jgi:anion-transporting  ArsA/GET3 family ATPase
MAESRARSSVDNACFAGSEPGDPRIDWFTDFGIPVGGVIVNMVIDATQTKGTGEGGEFVRNRISMQEGYLSEIGETFDGDVRAVVPLLDSDIRGVAALQEAGRRLFT